MFIGTQYYRPPNPRREDWERDLKTIKEHGLELVRTWLYWRRVNPSEGVWIWDEYDQFLDLAQKKGLKVLIQLMCDSPPDWFERWYPEARYLDADGKQVEFYAMAAQSVGGAPGPCFHNPTARSHAEEFMKKVAERYKAHPALHAYDLWNEIWMRECFCKYTQEQFRGFLRQKYRGVGALNEAWQRSYRDFSEVTLPKRGVYADMIDRCEFEQWNRRELMRWRYETVKAVDGRHSLVSHFGGACSLIYPEQDPWLLAEPIDGWGTSYYDDDLHDAALAFHATACAASGKPWWLSEQTGGRLWSNVGERLRTDEFLRSFLVMAMGFGAGAAIYWQWRPEIFGQESPHFGLTGLNGEPTSRTEMVKNFTDMLRRHASLFERMVFPKAQVGLLWEPRTIMYEKISKGDRAPGRWLWWENFVGWHRALMGSGHQFDILNAREVATRGVPPELRLLIAPMQIFERKGLSEKLEGWVHAGGVLIAGPWYGMYNEHTYANRKVPPVEWFGVQQHELYYIQQPMVELIGEGLRRLRLLPATHFIEALKVTDAEVIGIMGVNRVITRKRFGRGKVVYVGTFVGNRYDYKASPQLGGFMEWVAQQADVATLVHASSGCFVRAAKGDGNILVFLTNPTAEAAIPRLTFLPDVEGTLIDLLTDETVGKIEGGKSICLPLAAEGSKLLYLELTGGGDEETKRRAC